MKLPRRVFLRLAAGAAALPATAIGAHAQDIFRVTLLGTGNPQLRPERSGPATLVEAGDQKLLFDAGRGTPIRLAQIRVPPGRLDVLFITHYHSDHTTGIPDLWLTGWLPGGGGRKQPFRVIGPAGAKELMTNLERAYGADVRMRGSEGRYFAEGATIVAEEFSSDGVVYERNGVRVAAFEVDHFKPSYGYRIDYRGRSVLISGDTRYNENLIRNGKGLDVLIHEVVGTTPELLRNVIFQQFVGHHTKADEAAMVFNRTQPKLAVYTHIAQPGTPSIPAATIEQILAETRRTYSGPLQAGEDLMSFDITDAGVTINRPPSQ